MNILIDCGTHLGEGMKTLVKKYSMNDDQRKVLAFEPNRNTYAQARKKGFFLKNVFFTNKAVWISEKKMQFNAKTLPHSENSDECASSLITIEEWKPKTKKNTGTVECVHLSKFITSHFLPADRIILKLDIEGSEFAVLDDIMTSGAIKYVDDIYVEFHKWAMKSKTRILKYILILKAKLKNPSLKFTMWY